MNGLSSERLSAPGVWEKVLSLLGDCRDLAVLDAPAGGGRLSAIIAESGGRVRSLDIKPPPSFPQCTQADLNQPLPFENGSFDRIVCVEGIEHIENPAFLLREFSRTLKKGGVLILTTPNVLNIRSRIKFLLTGVLFWFGKDAINRFGHVTPISAYHLEHFAIEAGFQSVEINVNRRIFRMMLLTPLFLALGVLFGERHNSPDLLTGEILILKLRK